MSAALDRAIAEDREQQFQLVGVAATARSNAAASLTQVERLQKEYTPELRRDRPVAGGSTGAGRGGIDGLSRRRCRCPSALHRGPRTGIRQLQTDRDELAARIAREQESLESLALPRAICTAGSPCSKTWNAPRTGWEQGSVTSWNA